METQRIAVFGPNKPFYGAQLVQVPFYQLLRATYPGATIRTWSPHPSTLLTGMGLVDTWSLYDRTRSRWGVLRELNAFHADIAISLRYASQVTAILVALSNAKLKVALERGALTRMLIRRSAPFEMNRYIAFNYLEAVRLAGCAPAAFEGIAALAANSMLPLPEKPYLCLMPGGGEGEHKRWGIENFTGLCRLALARHPTLRFVFVLGEAESSFPPVIEAALPQDRVTILMNPTPADTVKVALGAVVTIANDCGPSHLAQMAGANFVSLWGWENQRPLERIAQWFLPRENAATVLAEEGRSIKTIAPERVLPFVERFLPDGVSCAPPPARFPR